MANTFLFNTDFFLNRPSQAPYKVLIQRTQAGNGRFVFSIHNGQGLSPYRAPFGSIEFSENWTQQELLCFVNEIDSIASEMHLQSMRIISYPTCYAPLQATLQHAILQEAGYTILCADTTYYLPVGQNSFYSQVHRMEQKKLRKFNKEGFSVVLDAQPSLSSLYSLIADTRVRKGYPVSMSETQFIDMVRYLNQHCLIFSVYDNAVLMATAVVIKVNADILYTFYVADHAEYRSFSPVVSLYEAVYNYAKENSYKLIDYGIGTESGKANPSLSAFKKHIGGVPSPKYTFFKKY